MNGKTAKCLKKVTDYIVDANAEMSPEDYKEFLEEINLDIKARLDALEAEEDTNG